MIKKNNQNIRTITGYGPQENCNFFEKMPFFLALEEEISKSLVQGKGVIVELDTNSKLGQQYIKGDPHRMSSNGAILAGIIERHALIVTNSLTGKSSGLITRLRNTEKSLEQSVIDFVLVSSDMVSQLVSCQLDSERKHVLKKEKEEEKKKQMKVIIIQ